MREQIKQELDGIKREVPHLIKNLNADKMNGRISFTCLYGQMFGNSANPIVSKLLDKITKPYSSFSGFFNVPRHKVFTNKYSRDYSVTEVYPAVSIRLDLQSSQTFVRIDR